jgi:hypothetical protein
MDELKKMLLQYYNAIAKQFSGNQTSNKAIRESEFKEVEAYNWIIAEFERLQNKKEELN